MAAQNVDPTDKKRYIKMDPMLQYINKNFISISKEDNDKVQPILKFVIETIITGLKENPLFKKMYTDVLYGGSSYSGLKVGKPEEFDIDLRLVLPTLTKPTLELSKEPGFVKYHMTDWATFEKNIIYADFKGLDKLKDNENYIIADQVLNWFKSTVVLFLNGKKSTNNQTSIPYKDTFVKIRLTTSGPAVTLRVTCGKIKFDVDLVVVFRMQEKDWPSKPFKDIPVECDREKEFMLVPKVPKNYTSETKRCWRMSFQQQESILLKKKDNCKTALRIIKKIRDKQNHKMISSYFIKTVFLHELHKQTREFWSYPLSFVLMQMLKKYKTYLDDANIPYYWNKQNNLLQHIDGVTIDNFKFFIGRVIDSTERNIVDNPYKMADYISTDEERQLLTAAGYVTKEIMEMPVKCFGSNADIIENNSVLKTDIIENNSVSKTDNDKTLIYILKGIQTSINVVQSDMKCALKKLADLEHSVQDLKTDNIALKAMSKGFMAQNQFTDKLKQQELFTADIMDQVQCLNKSVESLKNHNNTLKTCFQAFVFE